MNIRKLLVLFSITSAIIILLKMVEEVNLIHPQIWTIQIYFFCTFLIISRINQAGKFAEKNQFHIFVYIAMGIRFFLSIIFIFYMILTFKNQEVMLVVDFMVLYLFYTSFEIYFLIHNLRADLKKGDAKD